MGQGPPPGWDTDFDATAGVGPPPTGERLRRDALHDDPIGTTGGLRVVDLADEFHLTTAQALDVCARAGIPAAHGAQELDPEAAARFRETAVLPIPSIEETGAAARWAVPPPSAGLEPPPPLADPAPFVPLRIGDAARPTPRPPAWGPPPDPAPRPAAGHRRWRRRRRDGGDVGGDEH